MDLTTSTTSSWTQARQRIVAHWPLKFFGVTAFITVFFTAYFHLLKYPFFEVTVMPSTALDRLIPFQPWTLPVYLSLWFYVSLAPALLINRTQLLFYAKMSGVMAVVGLSIFLFWPTAAPLAEGLGEADALALAWLKQVDSAGNACPSLHVAFAVFAGLWLHRTLRLMRLPPMVLLLNFGWGLGIVYATLATKQHVLVDGVAGGLLGLVAGLPESRTADRPIHAIAAAN